MSDLPPDQPVPAPGGPIAPGAAARAHAATAGRLLAAHPGRTAAAVAAVLVLLVLLSSWSWITRGGMIRALGGVTATADLPAGALVIVRGADCPRDWSPVEAARGRVLLGAGQGAGLKPRTAGETGGAEEHKLAAAELPPHIHGGLTGPSSAAVVSLNYARIEGTTAVGMPGVTVSKQIPNVVVQNQTLTSSQHDHAIRTDGGIGLRGQPEPDNAMPPWLAVTICERAAAAPAK